MGSELNNAEKMAAALEKVRVDDANAASLGMGKADEVYRKLLRYQAEARAVVDTGSLYDSSGRFADLSLLPIPGGPLGSVNISLRAVSPGRMTSITPFSLTVRNEEELSASFYQLPDQIVVRHLFHSVFRLYNAKAVDPRFFRPGALKALASRLGVDEESLEGKPFVYALEGNSYRLKTELLVESSKPEPKPLSFLEQFDKMRESLGCVVDES
jgi:hypothetical protein